MDRSQEQPEALRRAMILAPALAGGLFWLTQGREDEVARGIKEVMLEEAQAMIAAGALVLDVRSRAAFETRHIAGALLAPLDELPRLMAGSLAYARSLPLLVYCGDGSSIGPRGTQVLNSAGFAQAVNLKPGMSGWAAAGLPVESGSGKHA